jgi:hypothetical protein
MEMLLGSNLKKSNAWWATLTMTRTTIMMTDLTEWEDLGQEIPQPLQVEVELVEQDVSDRSRTIVFNKWRGRHKVGPPQKKNKRKKTASSTIPLSSIAWMPHIYMPPTAAS